MNSEQARALVTQIFPKPFDKGRFRQFVINLLNHIDESNAQAWNSTSVKDAFKDHVQRFERLGTYTALDGEKLDVLIVHLATESKLQRSRTAIRNFVADHLKTGDGKDAALVAFVSPSEEQWRFSFVKMEYTAIEKDDGRVGVQTKLTPARRSSYIVGDGESCHTAQSRFLELLQDTENNPTLALLEDAFSVEAVTKEFFEQYKELFLDLTDEIAALAKSDKVIAGEFAEKKISPADFAKKLMGQIVFLYFLQKKGWLGVPKGGEWGDGPKDFLRQLFKGKFRDYKNFFNDILEHLFYDTLATDRKHEAWCDKLNCRIPFLNGGLFEPLCDYDWQKTDIVIPDKLFSNTERNDKGDIGTGILDVFDRYNFTVNEAEPLEKEVAIDPEMLGKVFENLLGVKERKSKGSFYTPREIVHYMCQESLINYLDTVLNQEKELVSRKDLEIFIHLGEQISHYEAVDAKYPIKMPATIEKHARLIDEKLAAITVCDPAIGSGAFPVGMMQEIVRARSALTTYFNDVRERTAYYFKRHAIQNCLYGVDIDPGAVEIAKLRLWLSLVVDEDDVKQIKPLPNLDYKIVVGNSLLGVEKNLFNVDLFKRLEELKPRFFDATDKKLKIGYKREIDRLIHELTNGKESFDFEIYFSEVFHHKGGFDVAIANPPYVQIKGIPEKERRFFEERYKFATGRFNLFYLFLERCELLLKREGVAAFIIPDRILLNTQCKVAREWLLNDNSLCELVSFGDQVFEAAVVDSIILIFKRQKRSFDYVQAKRKVRENDLQRAEAIQIPVSYFELSPSAQFDLNYSAAKHGLLSKLKANSVKLETITDTKDGIIQGKVEDKLFLKAKLDEDSKPLLFGANVERYRISSTHDWVNYKPQKMMDLEIARRGEGVRPGLWMRTPSIFERPKLLTRQTADEIIAAYDEDNYYYANTLHGTAITNKHYHPHFLLSVLNSKITTWFYRSSTDEEGKVFAQIKIELLRQLPIPKTELQNQKPLIRLVDRILAAKARDAAADVSEWTKEIDELVYELYGLTPAEIKLVEESLES